MVKLGGYPISNFYNKVKLVLLEKGIEFEEVRAIPSTEDHAFLAKSPLGKIPYIEVDGKTIFETTAIVEFLEAKFAGSTPLLPDDPFQAALARQMMFVVDLHVDPPVRPVYNAVIGKKFDDELVEKAINGVRRGIKALEQIGAFAQFMAGDTYTFADAAAIATLPVADQALSALSGKSILEETPRLNDCLNMLMERPASKKTYRAFKAQMRASRMMDSQ